MKKILLFPAVCISLAITAQQQITGVVLSENSSLPIPSIAVSISGTNRVAITDSIGRFSINVDTSTLKLSFSGKNYGSKVISVSLPLEKPLVIYLQGKTTDNVTDIEEVNLATGYQKIPKERATGSFSSVDSQLLNQQVGVNILDRLAVVGNGLMMDRGTSLGAQLMVRGVSTISGPKKPLIVIDNFPYEGDISSINPNIVENITILKDAAASSIWGARAANGVIVITTKNGKFNQSVSIELSTTTSIGTKPNLNYLKSISSSDFIDVEQELYKRGFYNSNINSSSHPVLSPVVDLLNKQNKGLLSSDDVARQIALLRTIDSRDQYKKYMYQPLANRQYFLNASGGGRDFSWISSFGYDDNSGNLGETFKRFNFRLQNKWSPMKALTISTGFYYTDMRTQSGRPGYGSVIMKGGSAVPYMQFADSNGSALPVASIYDQTYKMSMTKYPLVDWSYYPLWDWKYDTQNLNSTEFTGNASMQYKIMHGLDVEVRYQYQRQSSQSDNLHGEQSFYARNYVNSFARINTDGSVSFVVPKGGIYDKSAATTEIHNIRGQLNYNNQWGNHGFNAIAGAETRDAHSVSNGMRYYGYNANTLAVGNVDLSNAYPLLPTGSSDYIQKGLSLGERNTRFVSLFGNASYTYDRKYTLSGSIRRDASNLFGLKTNDQWNPFWSTGVAWNISNEKFYHIPWLSSLKLRGTYGFNGNINPAMVAVSTIAYDIDNSRYTGSRTARFDNYYNPNLRWETSRIINLGVDFRAFNDRVSGSIEYFTRKGTDLFGQDRLDYTTGIDYMLANVASTKGQGFDLELRSLNIDKKFKWNTVINFSTYRDQVIQYNLTNTIASQYIGNSSSVPITGISGLPVYAIFAYKWAGLDPQTGDPQGYLDGVVSKNYSKIIGAGTTIKDMKYFGSAIPTIYGSVINTWSCKNFSLDVGISYKFGYWFRRPSIDYTNLFNNWVGHSDYAARWQKPGDELFTNVPSNLYQANSSRDNFYRGSEILVEKGDHVRLQYVNLSYQLNLSHKAIFKSLNIFINASNLGILWKANKSGIDPDYNIGINNLKPTAIYAMGLRAKF